MKKSILIIIAVLAIIANVLYILNFDFTTFDMKSFETWVLIVQVLIVVVLSLLIIGKFRKE